MFKPIAIQERLRREEAKNKQLSGELQKTKEQLREAEDALLQAVILMEEQNAGEAIREED